MRFIGFRSRAVTIVSALIVVLVGSGLRLIVLMGSSFWTLCTAAIIPLAGMLWFFRPFTAARLLIAPLLTLFPVFALRRPFGQFNLIFLAGVAILVGVIAYEFAKQREVGAGVICVAFALVFAAGLVDHFFTKRQSVETRWMHWATPVDVPWAARYRGSGDNDEIELCRRVAGGYCFDSMSNAELKAHLIHSGKPVVEVQYNVVSDFGKMRSSSVRSVDGLMFMDEKQLYREGQQRSGRVGEFTNLCP